MLPMKYQAMKRLLLVATPLVFAAGSLVHAEVEVNKAMLALFVPVGEAPENSENPITEAKVDLGRMLYYDTRLSMDRSVSCNTCHDLASYGDDGRHVSQGIHGQEGGRSAPTVFNAAYHLAQFWDGRAKDVEEQAIGPVTNPIEMGMPDADYVLKVLNSIPGYVDLFAKAFPEEKESLTYVNVGKAIGAFERNLITPAPFDAYLKGDDSALTDPQKEGLNLFLTTGCATCHNGVAVGGQMFQKLGLVKEWKTDDKGRYEATKVDTDMYYFKVPSLRNITETGPYLHDGSIKSLDEMVSKMAEYQLGRNLSDDEVSKIVSFLGALKGKVDMEYVKKPELPEDGPNTPKPKAVATK